MGLNVSINEAISALWKGVSDLTPDVVEGIPIGNECAMVMPLDGKIVAELEGIAYPEQEEDVSFQYI